MTSVNAILLEREQWVDGRCETCGDVPADCACADEQNDRARDDAREER